MIGAVPVFFTTVRAAPVTGAWLSSNEIFWPVATSPGTVRGTPLAEWNANTSGKRTAATR